MHNLRILMLSLILGSPSTLAMDKPGYRLTLDPRIENQKLTMAPQILAPKGSVLRYEVIAAKTGASGTTSTRQGGLVRIDESSTAALSMFSLSLGPKDRCTVSVKVYDGADIVAEGSFSYPETSTGKTQR